MTLLVLQIRLWFRQLLGIRDVTAAGLRYKITQEKARRSG